MSKTARLIPGRFRWRVFHLPEHPYAKCAGAKAMALESGFVFWEPMMTSAFRPLLVAYPQTALWH